ncbi:MAG: DUF3078 domain-containing protein [Cyclobacteriaceae bacterium]|jgi:hypothetical protein|nr:DUF3078 domain-containing protein [Cyclobacteriaceae bacterium]
MKTHSLNKALLLAFMVLTTVAEAQFVKPDSTSNWKKRLIFNLNVNQASFSTNWKAGGINSIGLNTSFNYKANYAKDKLTWDNEIDFLYGFVNNQGQGFRKTLDRMFLDTKVGHKLNDKWDLFTSLNFLSQFQKGYRYNDDDTEDLISDFLAPAFITSAWGVEYHPTSFFRVRLSPFAPRVTVLQDNNGRFSAVDPLRPYGVVVGENTRFEWLAFQMTANFNKDITSNLNLKWRYVMFANYETLELKTIDHRLDLDLTAKVSKFISVGLGVILLYDFDQDPGAQLSQAFNFGFRYSFQNFEDKK